MLASSRDKKVDPRLGWVNLSIAAAAAAAAAVTCTYTRTYVSYCYGKVNLREEIYFVFSRRGREGIKKQRRRILFPIVLCFTRFTYLQ